jgi:predicted dienelactone hydrolase
VATTVVEVALPAGGRRALDTEVWYPATNRSGRLVPDRSHAPYPLLVFSQGYDLAVNAYSSLLRHWAAAGFVVAAPTYPYTAPPGPLDEADIINHPAELRLVLSALISAGRQHSSVLSGLVNAAEVGLAGHSDGGDVSLAVADNTCCHDPSVKALAVLSGAELSSFGGTYFAGPQVPLLVVQGSADTVNVPACSAQIYDEAKGPKYYLDLIGASHEVPYVEHPGGENASGENAGKAPPAASYRRVVAQATTDFFKAELAGARGALGSMERAAKVPGVAQMTVGGQAPVTAGWCPGSPA